jgi:hypothetical protein
MGRIAESSGAKRLLSRGLQDPAPSQLPSQRKRAPDLEARKSLYPTEAPPRFELGVEVLQTSALPLGYGAGSLD